jgi:SAM domain (Sterile alpha motif)
LSIKKFGKGPSETRLQKLGMSEYVERFAENRIDLSVLPDLTDQDLEKPGVLLGHRRKMLRPISDLSGASVTAAASSSQPRPDCLHRTAPSVAT